MARVQENRPLPMDRIILGTVIALSAVVWGALAGFAILTLAGDKLPDLTIAPLAGGRPNPAPRDDGPTTKIDLAIELDAARPADVKRELALNPITGATAIICETVPQDKRASICYAYDPRGYVVSGFRPFEQVRVLKYRLVGDYAIFAGHAQLTLDGKGRATLLDADPHVLVVVRGDRSYGVLSSYHLIGSPLIEGQANWPPPANEPLPRPRTPRTARRSGYTWLWVIVNVVGLGLFAFWMFRRRS